MFFRGEEPAPNSLEANQADCCGPNPEPDSATKPTAVARIREAARYGFLEMVDEIGFWLVIGIILTGVITALVPEELIRNTLGEGPSSHLILLLLGVPLYMCASASTPVGAALLLKGVSPGAALVFLLAGPATNASALVVIARFFGRRFVAIYLSSVVLTALTIGWLFDFIVNRAGIRIIPALTTHHADHVSWMTLVSAVILGGLLLGSMIRGSWKMATRDLIRDLGSWKELLQR